MLNIELAVLQTLDHDKWWNLREISARTRIQEQAAAEVLQELNNNGIVESRTNSMINNPRSETLEWRSMGDSINSYLEGKIPLV